MLTREEVAVSCPEPTSEASRVRAAMAEHARLEREILALEGADLSYSEQGLLSALRICRAHVTRELERRGFRRSRCGWLPIGAPS